jgi:hypothetical protein
MVFNNLPLALPLLPILRILREKITVNEFLGK